jgi:hypothetical protein
MSKKNVFIHLFFNKNDKTIKKNLIYNFIQIKNLFGISSKSQC